MAETLTDKRRTRWAATPTQTTVQAQRAFYSLTVPSPNNYKTITDLEVAWYKQTLGIPNPPGILKPSLADWRYYYFGTLTPTGKTVSDREYGATSEPPVIPPTGFDVLAMTGLAAWYDFSDAASITSAGGLVTQVNDKSPAARHLTAAGTQRPTTGTRTLNGKNVLDFDGITNELSRTLVNLSQPFVIYVVGQLDTVAAGSKCFVGSGGIAVYFHSGLAALTAYAGAAIFAPGTGNVNPHQITTIFNGATSSIFVDGSASGNGNAGVGTIGTLYTGRWAGPDFLDGVVGEVIICSGTTRDLACEQYLREKWFHPILNAIPWHSVMWASDPLWVPPADGVGVSSWKNSGSNSSLPSQATGTKQPIFRASIPTLNNKPALEFDGVDDYLSTGAFTSVPQPLSMVVVANPLNSIVNNKYFGDLSPVGIRTITGPNRLSINGGATFDTTLPVDLNSHLFYAVFNGAASKAGIDGVEQIGSAGTSGGNLIILGGYDSTQAFLKSYTAFVGFYPGDVTAHPNWSGFKTAIASFYGLSIV